MDKIEELEQLRAANKEAREAAEKEQYAKDLEALCKLEEEHETIASVKVARFRKGQPTRALLRTPDTIEYKRYVDQIGRAVDKKNTNAMRAAQELLANACWVYPKSPEEKKEMLEAFPGLLTSIALAAAALAEGKSEEEGKG